jgi:hypothetical protein
VFILKIEWRWKERKGKIHLQKQWKQCFGIFKISKNARSVFKKLLGKIVKNINIYILLLCLLVELKIKTRNMKSKRALSFTKHDKKLGWTIDDTISTINEKLITVVTNNEENEEEGLHLPKVRNNRCLMYRIQQNNARQF